MSSSALFEALMDRVKAGERLTEPELEQLATTPDILLLGMFADTVRRNLHGTRVTYVRVASCGFDKSFADAVPATAREVRITGQPETLAIALAAVEAGRSVAADRALSGFSWADIDRWAAADGGGRLVALQRLRAAGLEGLADLPLDGIDDPESALEELTGAGFARVRLTVDKAAVDARTPLLTRASRLQERFGCIQTLSPLPSKLDAMRPTTGYDDVKTIAIARLAAPTIPSIQVDWLRYGAKLAQVALTFGADDVDNVGASDDAPDGRRRSPLEELRRNVEAAGFEPAERDGRFALIA